MRLGVCTWIYGEVELAPLARRLKRLGVDGVEIAGDLSRPAREVRQILDDQGLAVLSVTPDDVDILHPDTKLREAGVDYYLRLIDWAADLATPLISCHGATGRIRPVGSYAEERALYVESVQRITRHAHHAGLRVAMELLNRYEAHFLNTVEEGLRFVEEVGLRNAGLLLDAYHMNIEEPDLVNVIWAAGKRLYLFHAADSNRQAPGRGHIDFGAVIRALKGIDYDGDIVFEFMPPGPDPFCVDKGPSTMETLDLFVAEAAVLLRKRWSLP